MLSAEAVGQCIAAAALPELKCGALGFTERASLYLELFCVSGHCRVEGEGVLWSLCI